MNIYKILKISSKSIKKLFLPGVYVELQTTPAPSVIPQLLKLSCWHWSKPVSKPVQLTLLYEKFESTSPNTEFQ